MSKVRAAIIGAGLISRKKHLPAFRRLRKKAELVALCDLNVEAAQRLAQEFGVPKVYGNVKEMIEHERPQLVDICTPPQTHAKLAIELMEMGCNVLIEKPMALSVSDCDLIVDASFKCGVKVCVAHSDLFYHPFMKAREAVKQGQIGEFRGMRILLCTPTDYMTSNKDHWAHRLPGGVIGETGPHIVYMTLAFINPIHAVNVDAGKFLEYPWSRFEDYRVNLIGERHISSIMLSYATEQWMARIELLGSKGVLLLDLESMSLVCYRRPTLRLMPVAMSALRETLGTFRSLAGNVGRVITRSIPSTHEVILDRYIDSIVNGSAPPVTAEEGREAVRVLGMVVEALNGRK